MLWLFRFQQKALSVWNLEVLQQHLELRVQPSQEQRVQVWQEQQVQPLLHLEPR